MKIIIVLILLVIIGGAGAGFIAYQHNLASSDDTRETILNSINRLKELDNLINTRVLESRYGLQADYDELANIISNLHLAADRFTIGRLAKYAEDNDKNAQSLQFFNTQLALKTELVESFKSHNSILRNSIKYAPDLGQSLIAELEQKADDQALNNIKQLNDALYRWALHGEQKQANIIEKNSSSIMSLRSLVSDSLLLLRYSNHVSTVVKEQERTQELIDKILAIATQETIDKLESNYLDHYVAIIKASEQSLYYVFAYAFFVLAIAAYLGLKLKESYSKLRQRDNYRSQQIHVAYKHLGHADESISTLKNAFEDMLEAFKPMGNFSSETQKKNYDASKLKKILSLALKKYRVLEDRHIFDHTDTLLNRSQKDVGRASELVKDL